MPRIQKLLEGKTRWEIVRASSALSADATLNFKTHDNTNGVLIHVKVENVSSFSVTPKLVTTTASGVTLTLWTASAAVTANGSKVYSISETDSSDFSGLTESVQGTMPREWGLLLDHSSGTADVLVEICYV